MTFSFFLLIFLQEDKLVSPLLLPLIIIGSKYDLFQVCRLKIIHMIQLKSIEVRILQIKGYMYIYILLFFFFFTANSTRKTTNGL